jgi:hypothetical protein
MHRFMSELGLSPVSRSRVSTVSTGPKPWEYGRSKFDGLQGRASRGGERMTI